MKLRLLLTVTFLSVAGIVGCADGPLDYDCTVRWFDGAENELETVVYSYSQLDSPDAAVAECGDEQATDPERPLDANSYKCNCESQ
jgi:hypothetical protein